MASKFKFIRLRIEDELITSINDLAQINTEMKAEIVSDIVEWFLKQRSEGAVPSRYFCSPNDVEYVGIWLLLDTVKRAKQRASEEKQSLNRLIYTALARYFECKN